MTIQELGVHTVLEYHIRDAKPSLCLYFHNPGNRGILRKISLHLQSRSMTMTFAEKMKAQAIEANKNLVLAEGTESRTIQAARKIIDEKIAKSVTLVGQEDAIRKAAEAVGTSLDGIILEDPLTNADRKSFGRAYYELRKHKGMTEVEGVEGIADPLRWAAMMVSGQGRSMVAGAENTTGRCVAAVNITKQTGDKFASLACDGDRQDNLAQTAPSYLPTVPPFRIPQPNSLLKLQKPQHSPARHSCKLNPRWLCSRIRLKVLPRETWWTRWLRLQNSSRPSYPSLQSTASCSLMRPSSEA